MSDYLTIVSKSLVTSLRGWLLVLALLGVRMAIAIAGALPFVLGIVLLVRLFLAAPIGSDGYADLDVLWRHWVQNPWFITGIAGSIATVWSIQFLLATLLDAGVVGELARAVREKREVTVSGFISSSMHFFSRMVLLRMLYGLAMVVISGLLAIVLLLGLFALGLQDVHQLSDLANAGMLLWTLMILSFGSVVYVLLILLATGIAAAMTMDDLPFADAFACGFRHVRDHADKMLVLFSFSFVLVVWVGLLSLAGNIWWLQLSALEQSASWGATAANAWELTFAVLGEFLLLFIVTSQLQIYEKCRSSSSE